MKTQNILISELCKIYKTFIPYITMKSSKILLTFVVITFLSLNVSALDTMKPATLNHEYIIEQTCASCSYVNITLSNTDGIIFSNVGMTDNGSGVWIHNFTPTQVGRHDAKGIGDINGDATSFASSFEVSPNGLTGTLGFYFSILILSLGIMVLGFFLRDPIIVILSSFGLYFVGLYILFNGIDGLKDPVYTWAIGIIILMIAAYISIRSAYELIVD